jgi:hypothetical protein
MVGYVFQLILCNTVNAQSYNRSIASTSYLGSVEKELWVVFCLDMSSLNEGTSAKVLHCKTLNTVGS